MAIDVFKPFVPGEAPWQLAGAEMSPERAALEAEPPPVRPPAAPAGSGRKRRRG